MAGIAVWNALKIVLMLRLGLPEITHRRQFGHDLARPDAGSINVGNGVLGNLLLLFTRVEDSRTIADADIVSLPIRRAWIMNLEEKLRRSRKLVFDGSKIISIASACVP